MALNAGDLVATSLRNYGRGIADNVTNDSALLSYLNKRGNIKEQADGGRTLTEHVLYGSNSSVQWFDGYDTFTPPTTGQEAIDLAESEWRQLGGFIAISGKEMVQNMGEHRIRDWQRARLLQLEANLKNTFSAGAYSDGTGSGGKQIGGLGLIIDDDPTSAGTVCGIDQQANSFWRNYTTGSQTITTNNILGFMNDCWLNTKRGREEVDLVTSDYTLYKTYWETLQSNVRYTSQQKAEAGFPGGLEFMGATVIADGDCTAKRMYFINSKYLAFKYAPGYWFKAGDARQVTTADYQVVPMFVMGNFITGRREAHAVLIDD